LMARWSSSQSTWMARDRGARVEGGIQAQPAWSGTKSGDGWVAVVEATAAGGRHAGGGGVWIGLGGGGRWRQGRFAILQIGPQVS
jgi:hypothetical protein